jgi:hypothetical protein
LCGGVTGTRQFLLQQGTGIEFIAGNWAERKNKA